MYISYTYIYIFISILLCGNCIVYKNYRYNIGYENYNYSILKSNLQCDSCMRKNQIIIMYINVYQTTAWINVLYVREIVSIPTCNLTIIDSGLIWKLTTKSSLKGFFSICFIVTVNYNSKR